MIFETLARGTAGYLNSDTCAREYSAKFGLPRGPSPFLEPEVQAKVMRWSEARRGLDWSYGGWMENRRFLWKGTYLEKLGTFLHLGVDFNAPAGTPVFLDHPAQVLRIDNDTPLAGGWGTSVAFKLFDAPVVLLYGHLDPRVSFEKGVIVRPKVPFGMVGRPKDNGGWYSHTHVQAIRDDVFPVYDGLRWGELDGYGREDNLATLSRVYLDPLQYVRIA